MARRNLAPRGRSVNEQRPAGEQAPHESGDPTPNTLNDANASHDPSEPQKGLGFGRRVRYLFDRVAALDAGRLWRLAGAISKDARKPRIVILVDMLYSSVVYEIAFQDYQDWDFFDLKRA